jgi:hypothetical protein
MRFDVKCRDCRFFKNEVPGDMDCANNLGESWDPGFQACDNFSKRKGK